MTISPPHLLDPWHVPGQGSRLWWKWMSFSTRQNRDWLLSLDVEASSRLVTFFIKYPRQLTVLCEHLAAWCWHKAFLLGCCFTRDLQKEVVVGDVFMGYHPDAAPAIILKVCDMLDVAHNPSAKRRVIWSGHYYLLPHCLLSLAHCFSYWVWCLHLSPVQ